jgi:hypothetical protein
VLSAPPVAESSPVPLVSLVAFESGQSELIEPDEHE